MLAAILESGDPERLYTGLSLLVSAASDGRPARGLVTFGALGALLDPELEPARRERRDARDRGRARRLRAHARRAARRRRRAAGLPDLGLRGRRPGHGRGLGDRASASTGVISTPQFLREVAGAQLVVV